MCSGRYPKRYEPRLGRNCCLRISLGKLFRVSRARRRHLFALVLWIQQRSCPRHSVILFRLILVLPEQCASRRRHRGGLDCSSLTLGVACVVTCADGHTAARNIGITMTCVFDQEVTGMLLEDSTHSCKWALCDLSTLAPPSTGNHDCPKTVFGKSCVVNCPYAISETAAFTVLAGGQHVTCEALTGFIGDHWLSGLIWTGLRFLDNG